jgi:two-component system cell cycle sensor histidine kinase/response regulator CckA
LTRSLPTAFFNRLTPRMFAPVVLVVCAVGIGFYFFVLRELSDFAEQEIQTALARTAKEVYDICDRNFTKLMQSGQMNNVKAVRIGRALTLGAIEDYAKRNNLSLVLNESDKRAVLTYHVDPALVAGMTRVHPERSASTMRFNGEVYYFHHFDFKPWDWHVELVRDTTLYAPLIKRVKAVYILTAVVLLLGLSVILFALERALRSPVQRIIAAVSEKRPPDYQGIHEFEFLSRNIAGMMTSLKERTECLEHLYTIGTTNRGEFFFNNIARAIADAMGLSTIITRTKDEGNGFRTVAVAPESGGCFKREDIDGGMPCDWIARQTEPTVVLRGAAEHFPGFKSIAGSAAECYIGLSITDRKGQPIGCVHLFGAAREVDDWDMNFIKTAGRMAGLEFELMEKEREQEQIREQMFHAQKLESLGLLAGGVAHDFNNLLMGIQGHASLMLDDRDTPQPNIEHIQAIEEYVNRAAELTQQLLGFARGGKYDVKPADINAVLDHSAQMFGRTKKEISIHTDFAPDLRPVEIDRRQMEQVFLNLFVNAWHAMPGGGKLIITTTNVFLDEAYVEPHGVVPGRYVKISVTDTGTGIDEATLKKIFDPFFTTREMGRGTGLGLAMVYGIVKNHEGLVAVHSEVGKGSTFTICLPVSNEEIVPETTDEERKLPGSETVLLVDDEAMITEVGEKMLAKLGYRVYAARGGKEAVELFRKNHKDIKLVIMDMIMPDMSGGETFDRLREIQSDVMVLLSSGYSLDAQAQAILNRGCKGFIQKPFNMNDLSREIRKIFDKDR